MREQFGQRSVLSPSPAFRPRALEPHSRRAMSPKTIGILFATYFLVAIAFGLFMEWEFDRHHSFSIFVRDVIGVALQPYIMSGLIPMIFLGISSIPGREGGAAFYRLGVSWCETSRRAYLRDRPSPLY